MDSVEWVIDHIPQSVKNWMVRVIIMKGVTAIVGSIAYNAREEFPSKISNSEEDLLMIDEIEFGLKDEFQKLCQSVKSKAEEYLKKAEDVVKDAKAKAKEELAKLKIQLKEAAANGLVVTKEKVKELEKKIEEGVSDAKLLAKALQRKAGEQLEIFLDSNIDKIKNDAIRKIIRKAIDSVEWVIDHIPESLKKWMVRTIIMKGITTIVGSIVYDVRGEFPSENSNFEEDLLMTDELEFGLKDEFQKFCQAVKSKAEEYLKKADDVVKDAKAKAKEELAKLKIQLKEAAANGIVVTKEKVEELKKKIEEGVSDAKLLAKALQRKAGEQLQVFLDSSIDKIPNEHIKKIVQKVVDSIEWVIDHIPDALKSWVMKTIISKGIQSITGGIPFPIYENDAALVPGNML